MEARRRLLERMHRRIELDQTSGLESNASEAEDEDSEGLPQKKKRKAGKQKGTRKKKSKLAIDTSSDLESDSNTSEVYEPVRNEVLPVGLDGASVDGDTEAGDDDDDDDLVMLG